MCGCGCHLASGRLLGLPVELALLKLLWNYMMSAMSMRHRGEESECLRTVLTSVALFVMLVMSFHSRIDGGVYACDNRGWKMEAATSYHGDVGRRDGGAGLDNTKERATSGLLVLSCCW